MSFIYFFLSKKTKIDWFSQMEQVITQKVIQHADLRILLMGTGTARIEYTDEHDDFWGTGRTGTGQNMLGKVMMRVREKLRDKPMPA